MYRLTKIFELPEEATAGASQYIAIDVPDPGSPTGWTTKKILVQNVAGSISQDLETTLSIGSTTGLNRLQISDPVNPLTFLDLTNLTRLSLVQPLMSVDLTVNLPKESGTIALEYDSGVKTIPIYNGVFGLADTGNPLYRPEIRVIGRTVYITGLYLIPMPTALGGSTLDNNGAGYPNNSFGDIYKGAGDGYQITASKTAISWAPILPSALRPFTNKQIANEQLVTRSGSLNGRNRISHYIQQGYILTDGRLGWNTIETSERNGLTGTAFTKSLHARKNVDIFNNNDSMFEYDVYKNSFDNTYTVDNRLVQDSGVKFNFDFDGSTPEHLGGFFMPVNFNYNVDPALTLDQIKTAFDSL